MSSARSRPSSRLQSFRCALRGAGFVLRTQPSSWIHAAATVAVVVTAYAFDVTTLEWVGLLLAITAVWAAEAFNTSLEILGDAVSSDSHPLVGRAKDVAAGSVLLTAIGAAVVGAIILGPYILDAF